MAKSARVRVSAEVVNASMLLYMTWLLLPAVQTTLRAATGVLAVAGFAVGVAIDPDFFKYRWRSFIPRALAAVGLPFALFYLLERGGGNLPAYLAQQGMFWFPLLWCAYARERGDARVYRWVTPLFVTLMTVTTLTTIGWLVQGLLRGGKVYAYARSLGNAAPGNEAYLKELMQRNIGGYDFIYASVLLLPVVFGLACRAKGRARLGYAILYGLQLALIGLSQYTYAILFALAITAVELIALLLRAVFRKLTPLGSMLWALPVIASVWLLRVPLLTWAGSVAASVGFQNAAYSLSQLLAMLTGGAVDAGSRLATYTVPLQGFAASPLVGSMLGGVKMLGMHSDLLDLLSGVGLLGTSAFGLGVWVIGRGSEKGLWRHPAMPHLLLQRLMLVVCLALGTVFYSREIPLALCLTAAALLREPNALTAARNAAPESAAQATAKL